MCGRYALALAADELVDGANTYWRGGGGGGGGGNDDNSAHDDGGGGHEQPDQPSQEGDQDEQEAFNRRHGANEGGQGSSSSSGGGAGAKQQEEGEGRVGWATETARGRHKVRYNVCPKSGSIILRKNGKNGKLELDSLLWGLVPHWFKEPPNGGLSTINAQCESVFEGKPSWREPREKKRCVVFAQGFYEWLTKGKDKVPHFVKRSDGKLMALAGLWDYCDYKGQYNPVESFTIITTPVNKQLSFLHSRMPAILQDAAEIELWLSDSRWSADLKKLIRPFEGKLTYYPVDKGIGKVGNESPNFILPVAAKTGSLDTMFAKQKAAGPSPSKPPKNPALFKAGSTSPSSSSAAKLESESPPAPSSSSGKKRKKGEEVKDEERDEAMNPDEDSPEKVKAIEEAEERAEEEEDKPNVKTDGGKGKGKKEVEVLELVDSSDEDEKPVKKKAKKEEAEGEKTEKHITPAGNEEITDFFSVVRE
ncbi:hypothetical protein JCM8547_007624 [Rhodosporidiobolus lusitaniae]